VRVTEIALQNTNVLSRFFRMAVLAGVESAVKIHIDRGDDLNARDAQGQTPLMLSASRNKSNICALLLDAGADAYLLDSSGRSALTIAYAAGAQEAAQVIEKAMSPAATAIVEAQKPEHKTPDWSVPNPVNLRTDVDSKESIQTEVNEPCADKKHSQPASPVFDLETSDGDGFNLAGWEAEEDQPPPEADVALSVAAFEIQSAITEHQPIDTSADWDDFEAFLPDRAAPLLRADDAESRDRLRLVLLRAIREGSIPQMALEDLAYGDDDLPDDESVAMLRMVVNDLGAETDERFEYRAPHENFEVFVAPCEQPDEEEALEEALSFVDELAGRRNDPLRIYQREFQRVALLTAEAEIALAQSMECGLERAIDALASWHAGIEAVLEAVQKVKSGDKTLRWLSSGRQAEAHEEDLTSNHERDLPSESIAELDDDSESQIDSDGKTASEELADLCNSADLLARLVKSGGELIDRNSIRSTIASIGLTRGLLMELADSRNYDEDHTALTFKHAIADYRRARDKMAAANLKLVSSIAKKYLYSGEPLEDLLQEGNIGLLKAVDKYDWRRGFKFSTYATWWIRQQVGRFVADKGKTIRVPVHIYEKTQRILHASNSFELEHGRVPTVEEIACIFDLPVQKAATLISVSQEPLSIEVIENLDSLLAVDSIEQFTTRDPMDIVEDAQLVALVDRFLGELTLKEARVVRMRFGIGVHDAMTLDEIGKRLSVTRERVRQIENAVLRKFKHPARLNGYLRDLNGTSRDLHIESKSYPSDSGQVLTAELQVNERKTDFNKSSAPTALDKLLDLARAQGITVEEESEYGPRKILVRITDLSDNRMRKLIRKLFDMGFEFQPGKGFWR